MVILVFVDGDYIEFDQVIENLQCDVLMVCEIVEYIGCELVKKVKKGDIVKVIGKFFVYVIQYVVLFDLFDLIVEIFQFEWCCDVMLINEFVGFYKKYFEGVMEWFVDEEQEIMCGIV